MPLISTVSDIPVYTVQADLTDDGQEHGNLAITMVPATFWIWLDSLGWRAVTSTATSDLTLRVERIERLLADVGDLLADD